MKDTFIVGIAGGSASGKSTFAEKLSDRLEKSIVFCMDNYFKAENERRTAPSPANKDKSYRDDNHPSSFDLDQMIADIKSAARSAEYDIIIAEGLLTLWDARLYDMLDLKIFVDCRADERIVRRLRRNMTWGLSFEEISDVYLNMVRYRHDEYVEPTKWKSDIIINGSSDTEHALNILTEYLKAAPHDSHKEP